MASRKYLHVTSIRHRRQMKNELTKLVCCLRFLRRARNQLGFFRAHICDYGSTSCSGSSIAHDLINQRRTDHLKCASCANCEINRKKTTFDFVTYEHTYAEIVGANVDTSRVFFSSSSCLCYCAHSEVWSSQMQRVRATNETKNPSNNAIKIQ